MSDTYYGLSKMEYELMKFFWNNKYPVSLAEALKYCNTDLHYGWSSSTLSTYLARLVKKNILHSEGKGYRCKRSYYPSYSVKPKFIDFIGFDDFYLPQKQSRE